MVVPVSTFAARPAALRPFILAACCATLAIPLAAFAYMGSFMRYSGDDYCYAAVLAQNGFLKAQWESYFRITTYSGNRFALTLFSGISDLVGPRANAVLPGLAVLLWVMATYFALTCIARLQNLRPTRWETALLAEVIVLFTLALTPDVYQSLYWRSAMLPYLAPLVFNTALAGVAAWLASSLPSTINKHALALLAGTAVVSILSGGFSETATVWQLSAWSLVLFRVLIRARTPGGRRLQSGLPVVSLVAGTLIALALLALSPVTQVRRLDLPAPPNVLELVRMTASHTYIFLHGIAKHHALPAFTAFLFSMLLAMRDGGKESPNPTASWKAVLLRLVLAGTAAVLLIASAMSVSAYGLSSYPPARALIIPMFTLILALCVAGCQTGRAVVVRLPQTARSVLHGVSPLLLLAMALVVAQAATAQILVERGKFQKWAAYWDARDLQIRSARQAGLFDLEVVQLDHLIPGVGDLSPDNGSWYNNCAEEYYDVDAISASLPGWDP
jgi:hypothetical protein